MQYLTLYHVELVNDATLAGLPSTTHKRVLMVWIIWLLTSRGGFPVSRIDYSREERKEDADPHVSGDQMRSRLRRWMISKSSCSF